MYEKFLIICSSFYYYCLIDSETKKKSEASATSVLPKMDNTEGSASYTIKEAPTKMKENPKFNPKPGMLTSKP
jgi:hypothetical protein